MKDYSEYKSIQEKQNVIVDSLSDKLNSLPKGAMGLVDENVRISDDYRSLKNNFNKEFRKLQEINRLGSKLFKKEIRKAYQDKYKSN